MDVLIHLFVGLHIIGIASLLGGFLTQMKAMGKGTARFVPAMLHGALTMLVTGVVLVGLNQADGNTVDNIKIGVKLALLIVILGLVYVKRRREGGQGPVRSRRPPDHREHLHRGALDLSPHGPRDPGQASVRDLNVPIRVASHTATAIHTSTCPGPLSQGTSAAAPTDSAAAAVIPSGKTVDQRRTS